MQTIKPDYIVGLVDGEGSFTVYIQNPFLEKVSKRRVRVEPKFYVKLVEKDKDILFALKQYFGCGSIYFQRDKRPKHQNCYRYEVYNRKDLEEIIIPFFQKNTLKFFSKREDFKKFCKIFSMILKNQHLTETGLRKMFKIKQTMH